MVIDQNTAFVHSQMLEVYSGRHSQVLVYLRRPVATIHLSIVILDQTVIIEMMIIDIETTGMKVGTMIMIGTDTIVIIMMSMIIDMDMTEITTIIENPGAAIVMCHRLITMIGTILPTEAGVVVQVDVMNRMNGIGHHDVATTTMNLTMKVAEENGTEAKIRVVAERKTRGVIGVAARGRLAAHRSEM